MLTLNILDYALVDEGSSPRQALLETTELARLADQLGYKRFWVPEQHHAYSIASSTPEMLMMHLASATKDIRIGSGGVMIPHYSPYKIAENFRMLEALHPNRIDLGIGNTPGGRMVQAALNEEKTERMAYSQQVKDIIKYLTDNRDEEHRFKNLDATPVIDTVPEVWMLGAGGRSTKIAAINGTSYVYAHFFRPSPRGIESIKEYRESFQPSKITRRPHVAVAVFVVVAETDEEANELAKAFQLWMVALETAKNPKYFPSVHTAKQYRFNSFEEQKVKQMGERAIIGNPQFVKEELVKLAQYYDADEVMIVPVMPGIDQRKKALQLIANSY